MPFHTYNPKGHHSAIRQLTGGVDLIRNLLRWLSPARPAARLDPFPAPNDYGRVRPWDMRDVPTMELLPVICDQAIIAIVFPYRAIGFETNLLINLPAGGKLAAVRELWADEDLTGLVEQDSKGEICIPLVVPGDCELKAIVVEFN